MRLQKAEVSGLKSYKIITENKSVFKIDNILQNTWGLNQIISDCLTIFPQMCTY